MKKLLLTQLMLLLFASVFFLSCGDDDDGPKILIPKTEGFYVYGTNTIAEGPSDPASKMILAILDKGKDPGIESKAGVFGKFMYIGANSTISFAKVESEVGTLYGAADGGSEDNGLDIENVPVDDIVVNGTLLENAEPIHVTTEGLYYVFVDTNSGKFVFMQIKPSMIGPATPNGWTSGTALALKSTSKEETIFESSITLKGAEGYRYKLNDAKLNDKGWHAYQEAGFITTLSSLGVPDYGVAWDTGINDVGIHISDMPNKEAGVFTVRLKYTAATNDWEETKINDFTNFNVGIIGEATAAGTWAGDGTGGYELKKPTKVESVYTWTWDNVPMIAGKEFIFLRDATWGSGLQIAFDGATVDGNAVTSGKIINAKSAPVNGPDPNFHVITAGTFDVKLVINAITNARTVTITE